MTKRKGKLRQDEFVERNIWSGEGRIRRKGKRRNRFALESNY
jgi:hypothetical protein